MKDMFKETCIWMSYRYAIGRHTIAAVTHAKDIFEHIDWVPEARREFMGEDIINEVNQRISFAKNLCINYIGSGAIDAYKVLFDWFIEHPEYATLKFWNSHKWYVDCIYRTVEFKDLEEDLTYDYTNIFQNYNYIDLKDWILLANIFKQEYYLVTVTNPDTNKKEVYKCWSGYECNVIDGNINTEKRYYKVDNGWPSWYIDPTYINKIEKL